MVMCVLMCGNVILMCGNIINEIVLILMKIMCSNEAIIMCESININVYY